MDKKACIILAAGLGKRMGSDLPKALTPTRKGSLIEHILEAAGPVGFDKTIVVTGHKKADLEAHIQKSSASKQHKIQFANQAEQLGTGHATLCGVEALAGFKGTVILLYGDIPLIKTGTLELLLRLHEETKATISLVSFESKYPSPYGRLVRENDGRLKSIVEMRDCTAEQLLIDEVNLGIYAVDSAFLTPALKELKNENSQKEYYLTDIVAKAIREGQTVSTMKVPDNDEALGVNTPQELAAVNRVLARRQIASLIESGVEIVDLNSVYVDPEVEISTGAWIGPNVQLRGKTKIGPHVRIEGSAFINNSTIASGAEIRIGVRIEDSVIGENSLVGPFAHLRPGTNLGAEVKVGNFVETKNAELKKGAKASHLTYLGDCTVGSDANVGAGTITCNYDGVSKHKTTIGDGAFIGSDSVLIAPVSIGDGAYIGAGSAISKDVPKDALAFTRSPLMIKEGWAKRKREKSKSKK